MQELFVNSSAALFRAQRDYNDERSGHSVRISVQSFLARKSIWLHRVKRPQWLLKWIFVICITN